MEVAEAESIVSSRNEIGWYYSTGDKNEKESSNGHDDEAVVEHTMM